LRVAPIWNTSFTTPCLFIRLNVIRSSPLST
jgi:hypothetical protein